MGFIICWDQIFGIKSKHIGVVIDTHNNKVVMVVNPDYDSSLKDPCWTKNDPERYKMLKISRNFEGHYLSEKMSVGNCVYIQTEIEKKLQNGEL